MEQAEKAELVGFGLHGIGFRFRRLRWRAAPDLGQAEIELQYRMTVFLLLDRAAEYVAKAGEAWGRVKMIACGIVRNAGARHTLDDEAVSDLGDVHFRVWGLAKAPRPKLRGVGGSQFIEERSGFIVEGLSGKLVSRHIFSYWRSGCGVRVMAR
ncbi:hypothetical protein CFBP6625_25410 (plasmid) [Agrobacterium tumefaciens]|nr:hypothetical protein CFBP6625_25410 [Agrobacterium tumefaciens]